jgi:hypothetical protein
MKMHGLLTKMGAAYPSEKFVSYNISTRCHDPEDRMFFEIINVALEYTFSKFQENQEGLELHVIRQLLVYADINLFGENIKYHKV